MAEVVPTPGPWRYDYEPGYCGEIIAANGTSVCTFNDEPDTADAAVMTAAPQLLTALRRAKTWIEGQMEEKGWPRERIESPPAGSHLDAINEALRAAGDGVKEDGDG